VGGVGRTPCVEVVDHDIGKRRTGLPGALQSRLHRFDSGRRLYANRLEISGFCASAELLFALLAAGDLFGDLSAQSKCSLGGVEHDLHPQLPAT
jgi:hypothetical protein